MRLKLKRVSAKSFLPIFTAINFLAGILLGAVVSLMSMATPEEQGFGPLGAWSIIIFPFLNGFLGLFTGFLMVSLYNFLAPLLGGGFEFEFDNLDEAVTLKNLN